jgi:hypothetical protein
MQMGRRGRKRPLAVEDEYWALVLSGVGAVAACRQVGIPRKTGYRWRAARGGLPPLRQVPRPTADLGTCRCWSGSAPQGPLRRAHAAADRRCLLVASTSVPNGVVADPVTTSCR